MISWKVSKNPIDISSVKPLARNLIMRQSVVDNCNCTLHDIFDDSHFNTALNELIGFDAWNISLGIHECHGCHEQSHRG